MNKHIMVIDDSPTVCKILEVSLHREGYKVRSFHDGIMALQYLALPHACIPHLIFLDLSLPRIDGYEVLKHLKAKPQCSETVMIIISRRDGLLDRLKGRLAGARTYLTKPFKTQDVLAVVQACIGPAQACEEGANDRDRCIAPRRNIAPIHRTRKITLIADQ